MKFYARLFTVFCSAITLSLFTGCDWSSGGDDASFNTSGESNRINVSGIYGDPDGDRIVSRSSGAAIRTLTIQQSGNRLEIVDNHGSTYTGSLGTPNLQQDSSPAGQNSINNQASFTGHDKAANKEVNFTGVFVAVGSGFRLRGSWIETGGQVGTVDAVRNP